MACKNKGTCGAVNYGVTNDGAGHLAGYAWGENVGWISFSCRNSSTKCSPGNYGVTINTSTGVFSGYAWGENVGWITFSDTSPVTYQVQTSWSPGPVGGVGGIAELPEIPSASAENARMSTNGSRWSAGNYVGAAAGLAAAVLALTAGAWYARRRWLR